MRVFVILFPSTLIPVPATSSSIPVLVMRGTVPDVIVMPEPAVKAVMRSGALIGLAKVTVSSKVAGIDTLKNKFSRESAAPRTCVAKGSDLSFALLRTALRSEPSAIDPKTAETNNTSRERNKN